MRDFYKDVLGFKIKLEMEHFVEFENEGVRFALSTSDVMAMATGRESYKEKKQGHALEMAFRADSPDDVDITYAELIEKGAVPIKPPADMPWNQRTGFFADPDGHIHEVFCDIPVAPEATADMIT